MKWVKLASLALSPVSHDAEILKKVMLRNGDIPHLTNFSQVALKPGQRTTPHRHSDMWEVYLGEDGQGTICVDSRDEVLEPGVCVTVEPGEEHAVANTGETDLVLTYFGIA